MKILVMSALSLGFTLILSQAVSAASTDPTVLTNDPRLNTPLLSPLANTTWKLQQIRLGNVITRHDSLDQTFRISPSAKAFSGQLGCQNSISNGRYTSLTSNSVRLYSFYSTFIYCAKEVDGQIIEDEVKNNLFIRYVDALTALIRSGKSNIRRYNDKYGLTYLEITSSNTADSTRLLFVAEPTPL